MKYPTFEEIEVADLEKLEVWYNNLPEAKNHSEAYCLGKISEKILEKTK